jgi:hypothetical protein
MNSDASAPTLVVLHQAIVSKSDPLERVETLCGTTMKQPRSHGQCRPKSTETVAYQPCGSCTDQVLRETINRHTQRCVYVHCD